MRRTAPKNQRLQERLQSLQQELSRVEGSIHTLAKAVDNPDREEALRRLRQFSDQAERPRETPPESRPQSSAPNRLVPRADLFEKPLAVPPQSGAPGETGGAEEYDGMPPRPGPDQRFAQYFVTGGLHSVRPLRQERRVQRNKAILMVVIALIVLYGVIQLLF